MTLHSETEHPTYVEGCWQCKIGSVQAAPSAMPTRSGGARAVEINATDKRWTTDMDAYKRLRRDGLQPPRIDGAADIEREATTVTQVEHGLKNPITAAVKAGIIEDR